MIKKISHNIHEWHQHSKVVGAYWTGPLAPSPSCIAISQLTQLAARLSLSLPYTNAYYSLQSPSFDWLYIAQYAQQFLVTDIKSFLKRIFWNKLIKYQKFVSLTVSLLDWDFEVLYYFFKHEIWKESKLLTLNIFGFGTIHNTHELHFTMSSLWLAIYAWVV